jgi:molybdopterin molybdotransferase
VLSSCIAADALAVIDPNRQLEKGSPVRCLWLAH